MSKKTVFFGIAVIAVVAGAFAFSKGLWQPGGAVAQAPAQPRAVPVEVATAVKKSVPIVIEALGTVTPMASVNLKSRVDSEITEVHFSDGAAVSQGDLLFTLDSRTIEAQIKQLQGTMARDRAQLSGAERDVRRYTELVAKGATPVTNLDNAHTQSDIYLAAIKSDEAMIENLRVQLSFCTIKAPISGRISTASTKAGSFVRSADLTPLASIIQTAPVYVTFQLPQRNLADVRQALKNKTTTVTAVVPGDTRTAAGEVSVIENSVDSTTGMVTVRATMPNRDEVLWPGTLVTIKLVLRSEESIVVPTEAVQASQRGNYVFVAKDGKVAVQPVKVTRVADGQSVIETGLSGGETVVTEGQLLLTNGTSVAPRTRKAQS